ncbi:MULTISPECIES: tetratricopeptide repeat protein [unclassified Coleofasciculus]|uniref:tetratricopeptide repeat protein n=1 Tax=unclassified Coleofasciculus TaxID=2692782 RepID=UPI00188186F7|nr:MULTISPECIES: hypothetical protein [unclassified Coleofasciculus]MBE9124672.1 hypothetical protein [Coleofasciculus sp. LEGE 07081]MBE9146999.1 hypothetical protein [Coleofasciculus sp. LEGE 07092]
MSYTDAQPASPLDQALALYAARISQLESAALEPSCEQIVEVLVARDAVEQNRVADPNPAVTSIVRLIQLDSRLKGQAQAIANDDRLVEWKETLNIPEKYWWWHLEYPLPPLPKQAIARYEQALVAIEAAEGKPTSAQVQEVLLARNAIEVIRNNKPFLERMAKALIELDERLKAQAKAIISGDRLEGWRTSLNPPATSWWWHLTYPLSFNQGIQDYRRALGEIEKSTPSPSANVVLELLLVRDAVERVRTAQKYPSPEGISQMLELDKCWRTQASAIANNDNLHESLQEWKDNFNPLPTYWWWRTLEESCYPTHKIKRNEQALKQYEQALDKIKSHSDPSSEQVRELLRTRDRVEKAISNQALPESVCKQLIDLDSRLKEKRLALAKGNQLADWKKSLNPPETHWWWNFKPTFLGAEDEFMSWSDRLWTGGAVLCLGLAAGFVVSTSQTFQTFGTKEGSTGSDTLQNLLVIAQAGGLLSLTVGAATQKGQKALEDILTSIPFIRPNWQAPATFGLSAIALGVAWTINESLPQLGTWYYDRGQQLAQEGQLFQAQDKFLQGKKLIQDAEQQAKLSLSLGDVYERQGNLEDAITAYQTGLATDNPAVFSALGRAQLLQEWQKGGWTKPIADQEKLQQPEINFQLATSQMKDGQKTGQNQIHSQQLLKNIYINQGLWNWSQVDLMKPPDENKGLLTEAKEKFNDAYKLEEKLPTTLRGRLARCYSQLAEALINRQIKPTYCEQILNKGIDDNYDAAIIRARLDTIQ